LLARGAGEKGRNGRGYRVRKSNKNSVQTMSIQQVFQQSTVFMHTNGSSVTFLVNILGFCGKNVRYSSILLICNGKNNWLKNNQLVWKRVFFSVCGHYFHLIN
jgi:hypothetical protein